MTPEWHLDDTAEPVEEYQFTNVNPNTVFLLAIGAAFVAVSGVYFAYTLIQLAISGGMIPQPPALQGYIS